MMSAHPKNVSILLYMVLLLFSLVVIAGPMPLTGSRFSTLAKQERVVKSSTNGTQLPCALVPTSVSPNKEFARITPFQEKSLLTVSHSVFDVAYGIVPTIVYQGISSFWCALSELK